MGNGQEMKPLVLVLAELGNLPRREGRRGSISWPIVQEAVSARVGRPKRETGMAFFRMPKWDLHVPKYSDWYLGSTGGSGVSIGTPEIKVGVDSNSIRVPISQITDGKLVRRILVHGNGVGISAGIGPAIPFLNFSWSPNDIPFTSSPMPGSGTNLKYSAFSPDPMEPHDFKGVLWVFSGSFTHAAVQAGAAFLVFATELSVYSVLPSSLIASGFCLSTDFMTAYLHLDADVVVYTINKVDVL